MTVKLWRKHLFQSTPPVKAATFNSTVDFNKFTISIHAAREGGDEIARLTRLKARISIHAAREGGD